MTRHVTPQDDILLIERTSIYNREEQPCKEAFKVTYNDSCGVVNGWAINSCDVFDIVNQYGQCVVNIWYDFKHIEIYDDWRE